MKRLLVWPLMLGATACSVPELEPIQVAKPQPLELPQATPVNPRQPRPFVRIQKNQPPHAEITVTLNLQNATLSECLMRADPSLNLVPTTPDIDLTHRYNVRVNRLSLQQYLRILEGLTGYALELDAEDPIVHVSAYLTRSWDVSTFAGQGQSRLQVGQTVTLGGNNSEDENTSSSDNESPATVIYDHMDSPWEDLLTNAREILGLQVAEAVAVNQNASIETDQTHTWLVADRRLGLLRAHGPVAKIQELDAWLTEQTRRGARQILLAVAILDVARDRGLSGGLDMRVIYDRLGDRVALNRQIPGELTLSSRSSAWKIDAALEFGRWTLDLLVEQLSQQGQVAVRSDPVFTVVNGMTTFLGDGEEVSYIANTDLSLGSGDREPLLATRFEHIRVGFRIAVTPRMRHDGSILVEVVPVLSSIRSQSEFDTGISTIVRPNIAIQEMATLAITHSGKPILLGGLIQRRLLEVGYRLPCTHFLCDALANATSEYTDRELMIVITPIEVAI